MATGFWLYTPLLVLIFIAMSGFAMSLVIRHQDGEPDAHWSLRPAGQPGSQAAVRPGRALSPAPAREWPAGLTRQSTGTGRSGLDQQDCLVLTLIACPQCALPAEITDWFSLRSTDGPVDHVAMNCVDGHHFAMAVDRLRADAGRQLRADHAGTGLALAGLPQSRSGTSFSRLPGRLGTVASPVTEGSSDIAGFGSGGTGRIA